MTLAFNSDQLYDPANVLANVVTQLLELPSLVTEQIGIEDPLGLDTVVRFGNFTQLN